MPKKIIQLSIILLFLANFINTSTMQANSLEPCFASFPDASWNQRNYDPLILDSYGQTLHHPAEVAAQIQTNPKDFIVTLISEFLLEGKSWQISPKPTDYLVVLKPGDKFRQSLKIEGKSCSTRYIAGPELQISEVSPPKIEDYLQKVSANFQVEALLSSKFKILPISISKVNVALSSSINPIGSADLKDLNLMNRRNESVILDFPSKCAINIQKLKFSPKVGDTSWYMDGLFASTSPMFQFIKPGLCEGVIYENYFEKTSDGKYKKSRLNFFKSITISFNVQAPAKSKIVCSKGNQRKLITGISPKCPNGWSKKS